MPPLDRCQKLRNVFETTYTPQISISVMAPQCSTTQRTKQRLPKFRLSSKNSLLSEDRWQMLGFQVMTLSRWTSSTRLWVNSMTTQTAKSMPPPPVAWWINKRPPGTTRTCSTRKWREEKSTCREPMASPTRWTQIELSSCSPKRANLTMTLLTKTLSDSTTKLWVKM